MASILVDTGVWYSICDSRDKTVTREVVEDIYDRIKVHSVVFPWPIAYEVLRTRFVRVIAHPVSGMPIRLGWG